MIIFGFFLFNGAFLAGSQPEGTSGSPENVTVHVIDSKTVQVFWSTTWKNVERYDITYNPAEDRVVTQAAGNSRSAILKELRPNTQYQVTVSAVVDGKNYKSRRFVFKTANASDEYLELDGFKSSPTKSTRVGKPLSPTPEIVNPDPTAIGSKYTPQTSTTVRGVEVGLVLLALVVWIIAIALFFHRWGKIRMLLPYQPDYKTQQSLKVPGTGTTSSARTGNGTSQGPQEGPGCVQHLRWSPRRADERLSAANKFSSAQSASGSRLSSAIFPASPSFHSKTSHDCRSPRRTLREERSRDGFAAESIPLCQVVTQPRAENRANYIAINVDEKKDSVDDYESKRNLAPGQNCLIKVEDGGEWSKKYNSERSSIDFVSVHYPRGFYRTRKNSEKLMECQGGESEPLFSPGTGENVRFGEKENAQESEKPKRYSRSSLKRQKHRFSEDCDTPESGMIQTFPDRETEREKRKSSSEFKTVEMKRKAFLRKISLQDTHLNYNQDYWLELRKSNRFHKSLDLGCFVGNERETGAEKEIPKSKSNVEETISSWKEPTVSQRVDGPSPAARPSEAPPKGQDKLIRCDSEPTAFANRRVFDSKIQKASETDSDELITEIINRWRVKDSDVKKNNWFWLPSNENIPLFSERNGLIETDFDFLSDSLNASRHDMESVGKIGSYVAEENGFAMSYDFSDFCEIKLTNASNDSDRENLIFSSDESDDFYETNRVRKSEKRNEKFSSICSTSPPRSSSNY